MELIAAQRGMELEMKLKRFQLEESNGSSRDSLSSVSSSLRAKYKAKNWFNSARDNFDSTLNQNPTVQEVNGSREKVGAPAAAESKPKPATDRINFNFNAKKSNLQFNPRKTFISSNVPNQPSMAANAHVSQPAILPLMGMKLPKLVLNKFFCNPLEWPEWSGQFLLTADETALEENVKIKYLKVFVTGKAKAAIEGMSYNGAMYRVAGQKLARDIGRPELVVNSQLRNNPSHPFIKHHDRSEIIKFSHIVSGCLYSLWV